MSKHIVRRGESYIITPRKDLTDGDETREIEWAMEHILAEGPPHVVIDLGHVSFINSAALGTLVHSLTSCKNRGGWMRVAQVGKRIHNLFLITRLNFAFDTYDSVEEALQGVGQES